MDQYIIDQNNNSIQEYNNKLNEYLQSIVNNQFIFELTKCCGYSEFLPIFSCCKLTELYTNVNYKLNRQQANIKLFAINTSTNEKLEIPNDNNIYIKDFIKSFNHYFTPIYPVPAKVVYKIYFDSGCCHNSDHINYDDYVNNNNCIIHK
jgi:hypothetical protein